LTTEQKKFLRINNYDSMTLRWPLALLTLTSGTLGSVVMALIKAMDTIFAIEGWGGGYWTYVLFIIGLSIAFL